jgi:hypothetical protein
MVSAKFRTRRNDGRFRGEMDPEEVEVGGVVIPAQQFVVFSMSALRRLCATEALMLDLMNSTLSAKTYRGFLPFSVLALIVASAKHWPVPNLRRAWLRWRLASRNSD